MPKFDPMTGELITEETDGKGTGAIWSCKKGFER